MITDPVVSEVDETVRLFSSFPDQQLDQFQVVHFRRVMKHRLSRKIGIFEAITLKIE